MVPSRWRMEKEVWEERVARRAVVGEDDVMRW
jgi:hypothetical protein